MSASHTAEFKINRFATTVPHYVAGRLNYPPRLIDNLMAWLDVKPRDHVLDLGCGPGFLAVAFAKRGCTVLGLDPDIAMLAAAREIAASRQVNCEFREGSSYDLSPMLGHFKLVTMGRSFHWMDREATLAVLDTMVDAAGAVACFGDRHLDCRENRWNKAFEEVRRSFERREEFTNLRKAGEVDPHDAILINSPFRRVERHCVVERLPLTIDGAVERALSFSASSPAVLGDRRAAFEEALRNAISPFARGGQLTEIVEFSALVGRRP